MMTLSFVRREERAPTTETVVEEGTLCELEVWRERLPLPLLLEVYALLWCAWDARMLGRGSLEISAPFWERVVAESSVCPFWLVGEKPSLMCSVVCV